MSIYLDTGTDTDVDEGLDDLLKNNNIDLENIEGTSFYLDLEIGVDTSKNEEELEVEKAVEEENEEDLEVEKVAVEETLKRKCSFNDLVQPCHKKSKPTDDAIEMNNDATEAESSNVIVVDSNSETDLETAEVVKVVEVTKKVPVVVNVKEKSIAYSALNRRINSALQNLKAKVEEFQAKNGGTPDFVLLMKDNMTEANETGRIARTNRNVVVSGDGLLFEAFKYKGLKFDPKTMQFTKKGKTLEKDFDMIESWLDTRCELSSPTSRTSPVPAVVTSPQVATFQPHQLSPMFPNPFSFQPFASQQIVQGYPNDLVIPVEPVATSMMESEEPIATVLEKEPLPRKLLSGIFIDDDEVSDEESEHGITVKQGINKKNPKPKGTNISAARRKSSPLVKNDVLACNKPVLACKKPVVKKKVKKSAKPFVLIDDDNSDGNETIEQRSRITSWIQEQAIESLSVDAESLVNISVQKKPTTKIVETAAVSLPKPTPSRPNPTNPKRIGLSKLVSEPAQANKPGTSKPAQANKPSTSKPAQPNKPGASKSTHPNKPSTSKPPQANKPGTVSARTLKMMGKVAMKHKPPPSKPITTEEISSLLETPDILKTPSRKRNV